MKFVIALTVGVLIAFVAAAPAAEGECKDMCGTRSNYNDSGEVVSTEDICHCCPAGFTFRIFCPGNADWCWCCGNYYCYYRHQFDI
ncbi:hypothetical protein ACHWQZ_G014172 [Mnemiopsis leidyi]